MTQNANTNPPASGQTPPGGDQSGQTPPPTQGQTPPAPPQQQTSLDQLPADIQALIHDLRDENKKRRLAEEAQARAAQTAEQERKKRQGEFEELAKQYEARVHELEPIASDYTALAEQVTIQIEAETKDWPAEVKTFDPGPSASIKSRMEWLNKSRPLIDKLQTTARGTLPGNRPNPTPQGQLSREEMIAANARELKKQRTYGI